MIFHGLELLVSSVGSGKIMEAVGDDREESDALHPCDHCCHKISSKLGTPKIINHCDGDGRRRAMHWRPCRGRRRRQWQRRWTTVDDDNDDGGRRRRRRPLRRGQMTVDDDGAVAADDDDAGEGDDNDGEGDDNDGEGDGDD